MSIKLIREFGGGYEPNYELLKSNFYNLVPAILNIIAVTNENKGFGQIKGITKKKGVIYPGVEVSVFKRSDKTHLWTVRSKQDGSYAFRNIAAGLECFVVGFDPEQNYNAVISDKVVAK